MKQQLLFSPLVLLILLSLASCSYLDKRIADQPDAPDVRQPSVKQVDPEPVKKTTPKVKTIKVKTVRKDSRFLEKKQEIMDLLETGDYFAALKVISLEIERGTSEQKLAVEYLQALNGTIAHGQLLMAEHNPGQAGLLFRTVLSCFPKSSDLLPNVALDSEELEAKIDLCVEQLMEQGLITYRTGQLEEAIAVWEQILAFDPQHQASQKAIQTAHIQLTNLKKITEDK